MATRMQQRRGTAAQWISTNSGNGPILAAGEIGYESDTNKFKIGDGANTWLTLDYFIDADSTVNPQFGSNIKFEGTTANDYETTLQVTDPTADRTITLPNATGTVVLADGSGNITVSGDLTVSGTTTTINSTTINATTGIVFEGLTADAHETTISVVDPTADRAIEFPNATGTVVLKDTTDTLTNKSISLGSNTVTSTLAQLNTAVTDADVASLAGTETLTNKTLTSPTISGLYLSDASIVLEGSDESGGGPNYETTLRVTDPTADRILTFPDATGTVAITTDISTAISNAATALDSDDITEGVTKLFYTTARSALNAPLASPTFTGTVTLPNTTAIGDVSSTEIGYVNGVTSAIQTQIDTKAPLASPTFTGTVTIPTGAVITSPKIASTYSAKTAAYTFASGDEGQLFSMNNAATTQFNIPTDATFNFAVGTEINVFWITGAGQPTIGAVTPGTTTVISTGATSATPKLRVANSAATCKKLAANSWLVIGDLS